MQKQYIAIVVALVVVGGFGYYLFGSKSAFQPDGAVCTMEALQCPDGSYVGREGAQCQFKACPEMESIVGTLKQDSNGFKLILNSPGTETQEVSYSLPIKIKVSNVLSGLVNKNVRAYGTFTEGAVYEVDHLEELTGSASDSTIAEVGVGKTVYINGVRITLNKVLEDSRCAVDVQCVWAGQIKADITLQSNTDKATKTISSNSQPTLFDSYKITIEDAKPAPRSNIKINPAGYVVTFKVTAN